TAIVYPGAALIEGTNLSEGRGTTKPFELIGAPFITGEDLAETLTEADLPGVQFRAAYFTPQFSKHQGELAGGTEIYVTDRDSYQSVKTGLTIVKTIHDMYPEDFEFRAENESGISFFDNLIGNGWVRDMIEEGASVDEMVAEWQADLEAFKELRREYLLYTTSVADIQDVVADLEESGDIKDSDAAHDLMMHLTAVGHFEKKGAAEKVVKHMNSFKVLIDCQSAENVMTAWAPETSMRKTT